MGTERRGEIAPVLHRDLVEREPTGHEAKLVRQSWGHLLDPLTGLDECSPYPQHTRLAVGLEVDAGDQAIAEEEGQHVIAVLALGFGYVDLDAVVEIPQALDPRAEPYDRIEGAEQGRPARIRRAGVTFSRW